MNQIPRIVAPCEMSDLFMYASIILGIPRKPTRALVVFPGMGEDHRVIHAVKRWEEDEHLGYLLVAGLNLEKDKEGRPLTLETLRAEPFNLHSDLENNVFTSVESGNTETDARWTAQLVQQHKIRSLTITTSEFHIVRSYLTLVKALRQVDWPVVLIPDPTPVSPHRKIGKNRMSAFALQAGEGERILQYQKKGDVASRVEFIEYMKSLYEMLDRNYDGTFLG